MKLCYVTDRKALPGPPEAQTRLLLEKIASVARAGVDWIQIREKDLSGRELFALIREAKSCVPPECQILVNDRLDVAIAANTQGVHLGEQSLSATEARRFIHERRKAGQFLIGVSTHSLNAVREAAANGADYAIFGPVFATPSKLAYGAPPGLEQLAVACRSVSIPVVAIGGITVDAAKDCVKAGAAGIAAIRLFQHAPDVAAVLRGLRPLISGAENRRG